MQMERAIVHIGAAHQRHFSVHHNALGMQEPRRVFINLHTVGQQLSPVGLSHHIGEFMVRHGGDHQADIHTGVCRNAQRFLHGVLHCIIRRRDIHHVLCRGDQLQIHFLDGVIRIAYRPIGKGLTPPVSLAFHLRPVIIILIGNRAAHHLPHLDELGCKSPGRRAFDPHAGILPVPITVHDVGILVTDIDAAGIGPVAVDDGDLPVIPEIKIDPIHIAMHGIEYFHFNACVLNFLQCFIGKTGQISEIIKNDANLYALLHPTAQHIKDPVPDLAFRKDIVLQKNIGFRLLHMGNQIFQKLRAVAHIMHLRILVDQKAPLLQIGGKASPRRIPAVQPCQILCAGTAGRLFFCRRRNLAQAQRFGLLGTSPQDKQDHAGYRQQKQQTHPAEFIGGASMAGIDPDSDHHCDHLQRTVNKAVILVQEPGQQNGKRDLDTNHQYTHSHTGSCRDSPLDPLRTWFTHVRLLLPPQTARGRNLSFYI